MAAVQLLRHVHLFVIPWNATRQASLSFPISRSLLKPMSMMSLSQWCHPTISFFVNGLKILSLGPLSDLKVHSYLTVKTVSKIWVPEKNHKVFGFEKFTGEQTACLFHSPTPFSGVSGTGFLTPSSDTRACTLTFCLTHTYTQAFCHTLSIHSSSQIPCLTEDHAAFLRNHSMCHSAWSSGCKQQAEAGPPASSSLHAPFFPQQLWEFYH